MAKGDSEIKPGVKPVATQFKDLSGLERRLAKANLTFEAERTGYGAKGDVGTILTVAGDWYMEEGRDVAMSLGNAHTLAFGVYWRMWRERKGQA